MAVGAENNGGAPAEEPPDFPAQGNPLPDKPTGTPTNPMSPGQKAVWYQRPDPLFVNTNSLQGIGFASQPGQPLQNSWYDKADVVSMYDRLATSNPMAYMLYEALAADMGNGRTGRGVFEDMVDQSAYESTVGNRITPDQIAMQVAWQRGIINDDGTFDASAVKKKAEEAANPYGTTTAKQKSVRLTDPDTAKANLESAVQTYLGRRTNPEELEQFISSLNRHERQNATVTRQTQTTSDVPGTDANGNPMKSNTTTSQVTKGGSNAQQYAVDYARGMEGAAEFQAATGYLDEFVKALKNPMDMVQ